MSHSAGQHQPQNTVSVLQWDSVKIAWKQNVIVILDVKVSEEVQWIYEYAPDITSTFHCWQSFTLTQSCRLTSFLDRPAQIYYSKKTMSFTVNYNYEAVTTESIGAIKYP